MNRNISIPRFNDYFTVGQAARILGVSPATLRNWDRSGKLRPQRHPHNGYRIYLHEDLQALLESVGQASAGQGSLAPPVAWRDVVNGDHFVQFYEDDDYLVESVHQYVMAALEAGQASVVIATESHRTDLLTKLSAGGLDVAEALAAERLVALDAADTLSRFMIDGTPDTQRFQGVIGEWIGRLCRQFSRVHAFGEMVALLWHEGNRDAAIELERLWNELGKKERFTLFCAYPIAGFDPADATGFAGVCACHSRVVPTESYAEIAEPEDRLRAIALLQQRATSLEAEIAHRREVEKSLVARKELADFFENASEGIHKVGPDGIILWANRAEYGLLGYMSEEFIGHDIRKFHADQDVIEKMLAKLCRGESFLATFFVVTGIAFVLGTIAFGCSYKMGCK